MFCYKFILSSGTYVGDVFRNDLMSLEHNIYIHIYYDIYTYIYIWYILREEIKYYYF